MLLHSLYGFPGIEQEPHQPIAPAGNHGNAGPAAGNGGNHNPPHGQPQAQGGNAAPNGQ
ncbi:hypothetical protein BDV93DRAFT_567211 [Ceratobasidium sp. AG-I]|nr:hypothetical protein BDV93DRAFT_567211 [Ceratobasidium sp. AG-I]